jgi:integrase
VPLGETAAQALRAWKVAQPPITYREDGERRQRPATLVFGTGTDRSDSLSNLRRLVLAPTMIRAGIAVPVLDTAGERAKDKKGNPVMRPRYGLHAFRHYAISSWLAAGIDLKLCQRWAGHATLALTLDTYGHLIPRRDDHQLIAAAERGLFG